MNKERSPCVLVARVESRLGVKLFVSQLIGDLMLSPSRKMNMSLR